MNALSKLKAGALQLTIFIVVVIALLLSSFLILVHTQKQFETRTDFVLESVENANRGISYVLNNTIRPNDSITLDIFGDEFDKPIKVHRGTWGIFEKITSISTIKNHRFQRMALVGGAQPTTSRTALYLEDNNKPLIVVGKTHISGMVYLPKQGVKPGNISGESYYGSRLIYGSKRPSSILPQLLPNVRKYIENIQQAPLIENGNQILNLDRKRIFRNSFFDPVKLISSPSEVSLSNIELSGHIVVHSDTKIVVAPDAQLKDVVLTAPVIEISDNVTGSFQAFASDRVVVGKNCLFNYPSALVMNEKLFPPSDTENDSIPHHIRIKENTHIKGVVAYLGEYDPTNHVSQIILEKNSSITGEVYCMENLELNGNVEGSVYTANFIVPRFGTIYQNHVYNSEINIHQLPLEYAGLLFENSEKTVVKWLY